MTTIYKFEVDGFTGMVASVREIRESVAAIKLRHPSIIGQECRVYVGEGTVRGDCITATFPNSKPALTLTVGATR